MRGADDALVHHLALEHGGLKQGGGGGVQVRLCAWGRGNDRHDEEVAKRYSV